MGRLNLFSPSHIAKSAKQVSTRELERVITRALEPYTKAVGTIVEDTITRIRDIPQVPKKLHKIAVNMYCVLGMRID